MADRNRHTGPGITESQMRRTQREAHIKTHHDYNADGKLQSVIKVAREMQLVTYRGAPIGLLLISPQKHFRPAGTGMKYSK